MPIAFAAGAGAWWTALCTRALAAVVGVGVGGVARRIAAPVVVVWLLEPLPPQPPSAAMASSAMVAPRLTTDGRTHLRAR